MQAYIRNINKRLPLILLPGYGFLAVTAEKITTPTTIVQVATSGKTMYIAAAANINTHEKA
jgi:GTP-binding protein EngB required for normal cell division